MGRILQFQLGSEKRVRISEEVNERSLFYPAYQQAFAAVVEIVSESNRYTGVGPSLTEEEDDRGRERSARLIKEDKYLYNYPNNMIAFSGGRGTGKSSAMLTFARALKDRDSFLYKDSFINHVACQELPAFDCDLIKDVVKEAAFVPLSPIDPTLLENGDEILNVILSRMYQLASDAWDKRGSREMRQNYWEGEVLSSSAGFETDLNAKNCLLEQFSKCFDHVNAIKQMEKGSSRIQGLDSLGELGDAAKLKCELTLLVEGLLRFCAASGGKNSFLVIQIDDTDMNIKQAYAILEDLRKYLMVPRIIVVMAANLVHLKKVVESTLLADYEGRLGDPACQMASNISSQYITKLFPQSRHIRLLNLNSYLRDHVDDVDISYVVNGGRKLLPSDDVRELPNEDRREKGEMSPNMQRQVLALIYRKTGLIFLRRENQLHKIIPGNMRLLAHFLSMLVSMADVEKSVDDQPQYFGDNLKDEEEVASHVARLNLRANNIARFTDYFLETWLQNNLAEGDAEAIRELSRINREQKVKFACCALLNKLLSGKVDCGEPSSNGYYGYDYLVMLYKFCDEMFVEERDHYFVFAIQTYFSLLAHSIAIERLVEFYGSGKTSGSVGSDSECEFSVLWPIFGSRIFPYGQISQASDARLTRRSKLIADDQFCLVFDSEQARQVRAICGRRHLREDFGKVFGRNETKSELLASIKKLVISCFADYANADSRGELIFDVLTPIINSLYLKTEFEQDFATGTKYLMQFSPTCRNFFGGAERSARTSKINILASEWQKGRSSALLVVLNWDLQAELASRIVAADSTSKKCYAGNGFYRLASCLYRSFDLEHMQREGSGRYVLKDYGFLGKLSLELLLRGIVPDEATSIEEMRLKSNRTIRSYIQRVFGTASQANEDRSTAENPRESPRNSPGCEIVTGEPQRCDMG